MLLNAKHFNIQFCRDFLCTLHFSRLYRRASKLTEEGIEYQLELYNQKSSKSITPSR